MTERKTPEQIAADLVAKLNHEHVLSVHGGPVLSSDTPEIIAAALTAYGEQVREEERERHQSTPLIDPTRFGISDDPRRSR